MSGYQRLVSLSILGAPACVGPLGSFGERSVEPVEDCDVTVVSTWPVDGSPSAHHRDSIEFLLSAADASAMVDAPAPGTTSLLEDDRLVRFAPDDPLDLDGDHVFSLEYCGGNPDI